MSSEMAMGGKLTIGRYDLIDLVLRLFLREHVPSVKLLQALSQFALSPEFHAQHDGADDGYVV